MTLLNNGHRLNYRHANAQDWRRKPTIYGAGSGGGGGYTGPLDIVAGATVAYGQRALSAAKRGTAIYTLREDGGNTTQSFNSDATTGAVSVTAINTFLNGANGFLTDWADQSGNANNAVQASSVSQPGWLASRFGTIPGVIASTNSQSLQSGGSLLVSTGLTFMSAVLFVGTGGPNIVRFEDSVSGVAVFTIGTGYNATGDVFIDMKDPDGSNEVAWITAASPVLSNAAHIVECVVDGTGAPTLLIDGAAVALSIDFGSQRTLSDTTVLYDFPDSPHTGGGAGEGLIYNSALSAPNRLSIRQNIATYYVITLP